MSSIPSELKYTKEHEWARRREDGKVVIGITDYAQDSLGDITYLELPAAGTEVRAGIECGVVESVKTFSDLNAPISAVVAETNTALDGAEGTVNESPYEDGWLFVVELADESEWEGLLSADDYATIVAAES